MFRIAVAAALLALFTTGVAHADVRTEEKTLVRFEGMLGRMINMFGGRGARDGVTSTVSVKGDRKMTVTGDTAQIIDLREEKIYDLNMKDRTYRVTTFADVRRQMEEARRKAQEQAPREPSSQEPGGEPEKQMEVDFSLKESGQKRVINGFDAREVVMTITVREKGRSLEESGGLVMTTNTWLGPEIAGMKEIADFDRRYAEKLGAPAMLDAQQMAMVMAMYPQMKEAMAKFQAENVNMNGTPVMTELKFEAVANPAQAEQARREQSAPAGLGGLGGLGGRLGRRIMNRGNNNDQAAAAGNRATIMTSTHQLIKVATTVNDADVALPAGFRERN